MPPAGFLCQAGGAPQGHLLRSAGKARNIFLQVVYFFRSCFYNAVMLIFEYKCDECLSVFECSNGVGSVACVSCGSSDVKRVDSMLFSPKKDFCPRERS